MHKWRKDTGLCLIVLNFPHNIPMYTHKGDNEGGDRETQRHRQRHLDAEADKRKEKDVFKNK